MTAYVFDERLFSIDPKLLRAILSYADNKKEGKPIMHDFSLSQALLSRIGSGADCAEYYAAKEKFERLFEVDKTKIPQNPPEDMKDRIVVQLANAHIKLKSEATIVSDKNYVGMRFTPLNETQLRLEPKVEVITFEEFAKRKQLPT